jgi:hypothetical protein
LRFSLRNGIRTRHRLLKIQMLFQLSYTQPTVTCCLGCYAIFWTTQYNTPRSFRLATTQTFFTTTSSFDLAADRSNCAPALDCENLGQMTLPFLIQIGWLVLQWGRHHPLLSAYLCSLAGTSANVLSTTPASSLPPPVAR